MGRTIKSLGTSKAVSVLICQNINPGCCTNQISETTRLHIIVSNPPPKLDRIKKKLIEL